MFFMVNEKYGDGFKLDEYKGVYSISSVQKGGDKDMAVEALRAMLNELIGTEPIPDSPPF